MDAVVASHQVLGHGSNKPELLPDISMKIPNGVTHMLWLLVIIIRQVNTNLVPVKRLLQNVIKAVLNNIPDHILLINVTEKAHTVYQEK